jgi:hypothetical protein
MAKPKTADDLLPLVAGLPLLERVRLMRLIARQQKTDEASIYAAVPPQRDEFSSEEEALSWEAEGWEPND